jgi:hypothetical protein
LNDFKCFDAIVGQSKDDNQTVYRILCAKSYTEIHIIKFFTRNDFYVIKEISNASVFTGSYRHFANESQFESAFDIFDLEKCISDNIIWYLPKQLIQFLNQTKTSRFIECDKKLTNYSKELEHHSGSDRRNFKHNKLEIELTKIVKIDQNCQKSKLTIFIHSSSTVKGSYYDKRQAARKTWISEAIKFNISIFFVIGEQSDNQTQKTLESEAFQYKDMIQFGFKDDYYNQTLKDIAILRWVQHKCLDTKYFMKADDDVMISTKLLIESLQNLKSGITGVLFYEMPPMREVDNPWFMPECMYPYEFYPEYVCGGCFFMTKDIFEPMIRTIEHYSGPVFDIEDMFITGFLAERAGIKRYDSNLLLISMICFTDICEMFSNIALINCDSADEILKLWEKWKETTPESCNFTAKP